MYNFLEDDMMNYQRPYNPYDKLVSAFMNIFNSNQAQPKERSYLPQMMPRNRTAYDMYQVDPYQSQAPQNEIYSLKPKEQKENVPLYNIPFQKPDEDSDLKGDKYGSLMNLLKQRESKGNYAIRNNLGFSGAYQFGAPALEDVGLLKKGAGKLGNKGLKNPSNWLIPGGLESFLSNKTIQDDAMRKLMDRNRSTLKKMGLIKENTPQNLINAMLAAAHLGGPGGVKNYLRGINSRDAYGTPISEYFKLGMGAS